MEVYTVSDHIISPLGSGTAKNFDAILEGTSGVSRHFNNAIFPDPVFSGIIERDSLPFQYEKDFTYLENLLIHSINELLRGVPLPDKRKTILVISTTKGNVDLLEDKENSNIDPEAVFLPVMAHRINRYFGLLHSPIVISNACISGVSAILTAKKLIEAGVYDHAIVVGVDIVTEFVLSGFHSFMALSDKPCKPYDKERNGINIGEACATILLSKDKSLCSEPLSLAMVASGGQSNDANHISGPSRTGEGLLIATKKALDKAKMTIEEINYINAHGTATLYNDEMEAQAFDQLKANNIPLNSLKGFYGHTLGASGVIESILAIWQMNKNILIKSLGFNEPGVTKPLNIIEQNVEKEISSALKTSSGFGGCNGAVIFRKQ